MKNIKDSRYAGMIALLSNDLSDTYILFIFGEEHYLVGT